MQQDGSLPSRTHQNLCEKCLPTTTSQVPEDCVSLLKKHGSIGDFMKANNPSVQLQICKDTDTCFFGDAPTLSILDHAYGKNSAEAWLVPQLAELSLCCGLKEDASKEQLRFIAVVIATDFHWLKTSELMLFFFRFKAGYYERFFSRFDPQTILLSLQEFIQDRARAWEIHDEEERRMKDAEHKARCISFKEYCKRVGVNPSSYILGEKENTLP